MSPFSDSSILWFQQENTPTEDELAAAFYLGTITQHSRMRSHIVEIEQKLPEGPLWKLLKLFRLVGDKAVSRMAFEEQEAYLLPSDVQNAHEHDKDGPVDHVVPATPGLRGPELLKAKHIRTLQVDSEAEIWADITRIMEVSFHETSKALWEVWIYRNRDPNARKHRNAVVFRISHVIGDGMSLMKLATGFFQTAGTGKHLEFTPPPRWEPKFDSWIDRVKYACWDTYKMLGANIHVAKFLFQEDTHTEFKVGWFPERFKASNKRTVQVFEPVAIVDINRVREAAQKKLGGLERKPTINDFLHALFAGTAVAYLRERRDAGFLEAEKKGKLRMRAFSPFMVSCLRAQTRLYLC